MKRPNAQRLHNEYTEKIMQAMLQDGYALLSRTKQKDGSVHDFTVEKDGISYQVKTVFLYGKTDIMTTLRAQVLYNRIRDRSDASGQFMLITNGRLYKPWRERYKKAGIITVEKQDGLQWSGHQEDG